MKEKIIKIINIITAVCTGAILSSLLITKTEKWHWYLPICLICITLRNHLKDK